MTKRKSQPLNWPPPFIQREKERDFLLRLGSNRTERMVSRAWTPSLLPPPPSPSLQGPLERRTRRRTRKSRKFLLFYFTRINIVRSSPWSLLFLSSSPPPTPNFSPLYFVVIILSAPCFVLHFHLLPLPLTVSALQFSDLFFFFLFSLETSLTLSQQTYENKSKHKTLKIKIKTKKIKKIKIKNKKHLAELSIHPGERRGKQKRKKPVCLDG